MSSEDKSENKSASHLSAARFDEFVETYGYYLLIGALVLLAVSFTILTSTLKGDVSKDIEQQAFDIPEETSTSGTVRALDGVMVEQGQEALLPLGVIVENNIEAWPLAGMSRANLVIEAPAEGSITRFLTVFDASATVDRIGPVRSARPYYVEWAHGLNALFAHVGGSPAGLDLINTLKSSGFRDLNQFFNASYFWRSNQRAAPHNVYTRTDILLEAATQYEFEADSFRPWQYTDEARESEEEVEVQTVHIPYDGVYEAYYEYDREQADYIRYQNGSIQKDEDGEWIRVKNIVVLLTSARVLDNEGRLDLRTTGSGPALIFRNGKRIDATWTRRSGQHIQFKTVDTLDVPLARGTTWVSVLTKQSQFNRVVE